MSSLLLKSRIFQSSARVIRLNGTTNVANRHLHHTAPSMSQRHHFAPLGKGSGGERTMQLQGIVFDMDGTLCEPQNYMFGQMRAAVDIPKGEDILDFIHALPEPEQTEAFAKIKAIESDAMGKQVPSAGLITLMDYLDQQKIRKGICTRNFDAPVAHLLEAHIPSHINPFAPIITRDFRPPKPSPAGILHIAQAWGITSKAAVGDSPVEALPIVMVGDSVDDMAAGRSAGALTVLLKSEGKEDLEVDERTDVVINRLDDLIGLLESGLKSTR